MFAPSHRFLCCLLLLLRAHLAAQVADVDLPQPSVPGYNRPDLSAKTWDLGPVTLNEDQQQQLVDVIVSIVRDYPDHPAVTPVWKSRLLAIALRFRPEDRAAVVAAGQLARGVVPQPLHQPAPPLDRMALSLLKFATVLLDNATDKTSTNYILGYHLLDAAVQFDKSNRVVWDSFQTDAPALRWGALVPKGRPRNSVQAEETPDLKLQKTEVQVFLMEALNGLGKPALKTMQANATRSARGPRQALELILPKDIDKAAEEALPQLRNLLRSRTPQWPGGWRVDMEPFGVPASGQPAALLGMTLLLDSLVTGTELSRKTYLACGLDPATGKLVRTLSLDMLMQASANLPEDVILVVPEMDFTAFQDFLLVFPERWTDLVKCRMCVARNLSECIALLSANRPPGLQRSLDAGQAVLNRARQNGIAGLRSEALQQAMADVLRAYPNDLTTKILEAIGLKHLPAQLSKVGAMNILGRFGIPVNRGGSQQFPTTPWQDKLSATPWAKCRIQIDRLRPQLPIEAKGYADALVDLARIYDNFVLYPPPNEPLRQEAEKRIKAARGRLNQAYQEFRKSLPVTEKVTAEPPSPPDQPKPPTENPDGEPVPEGMREF